MSAGRIKGNGFVGDTAEATAGAAGAEGFPGELDLWSTQGRPLELDPGRDPDIGLVASVNSAISCGPILLLRGGKRADAGPVLCGTGELRL